MSSPGTPWRSPWFATTEGWRRFLAPTLVLPTRRQWLPTILLHLGLAAIALPAWVAGIFRPRRAPARVLFVGRFHLGDLLMLAPALVLAREHLRGTWFALVVQQRYSAELDFAAMVDEVLPEIDESKPFAWRVAAWRRRFRECRADCVVFHRFTRPDLPAAVAALLENLPHRVGGGDKGIQALLTDVYFPAGREKVVEYHLHLISSWLRLPRPASSLVWPRLIDVEPQPPDFDVLIAPFAQHSKIWPRESWRALLVELRSLGLRVAVSASPSDADGADELIEGFPEVVNLARKSRSLKALFQAVANSRCVVTVDTGIRHVAAALSVPCIVLGHGREHRRIMDAYVPSERYLWNAVPCAPCGAEPCPLGHLQCIRGITVEEVLGTFQELMPGLNARVT